MAIREVLHDNSNYKISYEIINPQAKQDMIFLHGWGSNKEIMKSSFKGVFQDFRHIYIDMPGFGNSSINKPICTQDYANIIDIFLKDLHVEKNFIFGHSFGGKVATLLNPKILVLLSSAGIVVEKKLSVKMKIKVFKLFKNILPKGMFRFFASKDVSGMSQVMYEVFKKVVDEDFTDKFASRKNKTFIFWGKNDSATPLESGKNIHTLIKNSSFNFYDGDHFFFTKYAKDIEKEVIVGI